jgi:hypothetical protein
MFHRLSLRATNQIIEYSEKSYFLGYNILQSGESQEEHTTPSSGCSDCYILHIGVSLIYSSILNIEPISSSENSTYTGLYGIASQEIENFIVMTVGTSNPTS